MFFMFYFSLGKDSPKSNHEAIGEQCIILMQTKQIINTQLEIKGATTKLNIQKDNPSQERLSLKIISKKNVCNIYIPNVYLPYLHSVSPNLLFGTQRDRE